MKKTLIIKAKNANVSVEVLESLLGEFNVCITTAIEKEKFLEKWDGFVDAEASRPVWKGEGVGISNYIMKGDFEICYEDLKTKKCELCGKRFWYNRKNAKYCSEECKKTANYKLFKKRMSDPEKLAQRREYMKLQMRRRRAVGSNNEMQ